MRTHNKSANLILVRTVIELLKHKTYYVNEYSKYVGPFNEALRRICNNYSFAELYELAALASVLHCEIQSVYPYIDYRAEMKIMNAIYRSVDLSVPSNGKLIIFWCSTEDEVSTRARQGNCGIWSPNHFVPLLQQHQRLFLATDEQTIVILDL